MTESYTSTMIVPALSTKIVTQRKMRFVQDKSPFQETFFAANLRHILKNNIDAFRLADSLNLNPSTIQKIRDGRPVSQSIIKKIKAAILSGDLFDEKGIFDQEKMQKPNHSTIERFMEVYRLYEVEKNLNLVGIKLGLCRERVRQLLKKGAEIGLFKYEPQKPPLLSREKILRDFGRHLKLKAVAKANQISPRYLSKLMALHSISKFDLEAIRLEGQKRQCIKQYRAVVDKLGRHPKVAELQSSKSTRSLEYKIRKIWGSVRSFRFDINSTSAMTADR